MQATRCALKAFHATPFREYTVVGIVGAYLNPWHAHASPHPCQVHAQTATSLGRYVLQVALCVSSPHAHETALRLSAITRTNVSVS